MSAYADWSREELIAKIEGLEEQLPGPIKERYFMPKKNAKPFDFYSYPQRKIALKFLYHGWLYNGLVVQNQPTPLPTVEAVLFDALCRARLIDRSAGYEGCDWTRCGRTDRGVSSAGQVVALNVRSTLRPVVEKAPPEDLESEADIPKKTAEEIRYVHILNKLLPASIRILAWSPVASDFSARSNCRWRHYKYFFNSPPTPAPPVDIQRMNEAARRLLGTHDFRNFCKLDGSKQVEKFYRRIDFVSISAVENSPSGPLYVFDLKGSSFLWHQVRHIMGVLFLIGQGLEPVSIVDALLNASPDQPNPDPSIPFLGTRPLYEMAEGLPLVLWECGFEDTDVSWRADVESELERTPSANSTSLLEGMHSSFTVSLLQTTLHEHFLQAASRYHEPLKSDNIVRVQSGGGRVRHSNRYIPLMKRRRGPSAAEVNENWRQSQRGQLVASRRIKKREEANGTVEQDE